MGRNRLKSKTYNLPKNLVKSYCKAESIRMTQQFEHYV